MSDQIPNHFVQSYTTNLQLLLQQKESRLRGAVTSGSYVGKQAVAVDQIGQAVANKRTGQYTPLVNANLEHKRRWISPTNYDWSELIDNFSLLKTLTNPQSQYARSAQYAMNRAIDDEILKGIFESNQTGENGTTLVNAQTGIGTEVGGADSNLNLEKLRMARYMLMKAEADMDEPLYIIMTSSQHNALLAETQLINLDYTNKPALVDGRINAFMGFNFIISERLPKVGDVRSCVAFAKSGVHLGIWNDIKTSIDRRYDLSSLPYQIYTMLSCGACRTQEELVVPISCTEND